MIASYLEITDVAGGLYTESLASYDKILDPWNFAREISNYHFIPFG